VREKPEGGNLRRILDDASHSPLTALGSPPIISQVMSISRQVAKMFSDAWELAARDCGAEWALSTTLSLRHQSRRGNYQHSVPKRSGFLSLSLHW